QVTLISFSTAFVMLAAVPSQGTNGWKSEQHEFSTSRQCVGGREIAGFSARQTQVEQEENLTPPAGLKPVEQEAWLAIARREEASGGTGLTSFYPARYGEPFVVEGEGGRGGLRPGGGTDVTADNDHGQVVEHGADSAHQRGRW